MLKFLKTTLVGGIFFLIPIVICIAIIGKALAFTKKVAMPLSALIPVDSIGNIGMVNLLALGLVLLICFLAGLAAKLAISRKSVHLLEDRVLSKIPAYELLKSKLQGVVQTETVEGMKPVLARFDDSWQMALEIERIPGGVVTLFLFGAPDPWSGSVCYMTEDRVQSLDVPLPSVLRTLKVLGRGSGERLRDYLQNEPL